MTFRYIFADKRLIYKKERDIVAFSLLVPETDRMADSSGDKGCNRKKRAVHSTLSLVEFPRYGIVSEISQSSNECNSSEVGSDRCREEPEVHVNELVDWNDPIASNLEELLLSNLQTIFQSAIREIVEFGYSEDVAEMALSRKALYIDEGNPVSNIVHDTLDVLKAKDVAAMDIVFENIQHLLHYTLVEMVSVLREVRPSLSVGEAMWVLLICDLNISRACASEDYLRDVVGNGESSASSSIPQSKSEVQTSDKISNCISTIFQKHTCCSHQNGESATSSSIPQSKSDVQTSDKISNFISPTFQKHTCCGHQNHKSEAPKCGSFEKSNKKQSSLATEGVKILAENASLPITAAKCSGTSGTHTKECKYGSCSKRHNRKEIAMYRHKFLHMEKAYRACGKGGLKSGKFATVGGLVVEKRFKPPSNNPNQQIKCGSSNTKSTKGVCAAGSACQILTNSQGAIANLPEGGSSGTLPTKVATPETVSKPKSELHPFDTRKIADYFAGIPYDESLGQFVPRDHNDKLVLKLMQRVQTLQDELQTWNDWARQKVTQVTNRLGTMQAELKTLRQEKQEVELFRKDQEILEENAVKRISEMENALENSNKQSENATSSALMLEAEMSLLKKELSNAKLSVVKSATRYKQTLEREQMALKKAQLLESQKGLLQDELQREKHKLTSLQKELDEEKNIQAKAERKLGPMRAAKEELLAQAASIRKEREQLEARMKSEEKAIRKEAASDMQKYVEDIARLERELVELKLKSESEKIAALRRGIDERNDDFSRTSKITPTMNGSKNHDTSQSMVSRQDKLPAEDLSREQECVMCLSEVISVVFLPCAHQVVCTECNELHEKQGMKECPSCRTPIQLRVHARFVDIREFKSFGMDGNLEEALQ